jgi:tetratricopeptide (TPR) repeat protein
LHKTGRRLANSRTFHCFWIAVCVLLLYLPVRHFAYISLDDPDYVSDNPNISSGLGIRNLVWAFTSAHSSNWHPLTWVSHMLDCDLFGLNPGAHHLVNVAFHAANAVLLLLLLSQMTGQVSRSAVVAALFAFHPLHIESVAWVAERKDVLSGLFWLGTCLAYVWYARRPNAGRYAVTTMLFVCGLLAKPMVVTLPFVLLLLDYWPLCRIRGLRPNGPGKLALRPQPLGRLIYEKLPLLGLSVVCSVITFLSQRQSAMVALDVLPLGTRLANAVMSYVRYLEKAVLPFDLAIIYPLIPNVGPEKIALTATLLAVVSIAAFRYARSHPYFLVGWLWYLGTLVPVIGIVQVGEQGMADRYTYLPLIGIFVASVWGVSEFFGRRRVRATVLVAASVIIIAACVTASFYQIQYWRDDYTLFTHATRAVPQGATAHALLADALIQRGEDAEAAKHLADALTIRPRSAKIHYQCGLVEAKQGHYKAAAERYAEAVELRPDFADAYNELGIVLSKLGQLPKAAEAFTEAIKKNDKNAKAYNNRAIVWTAQGDSAAAVSDYRRALKLNSNQMGALKNLAWLEATDENVAIRNGAEAVRLAERACELTRFEEAHALEILAASEAETGDFDMAIKTVQKALEVSSGSADSKRDEMLSRFATERDLYQEHKPFRRTSSTAHPSN